MNFWVALAVCIGIGAFSFYLLIINDKSVAEVSTDFFNTSVASERQTP